MKDVVHRNRRAAWIALFILATTGCGSESTPTPAVQAIAEYPRVSENLPGVRANFDYVGCRVLHGRLEVPFEVPEDPTLEIVVLETADFVRRLSGDYKELEPRLRFQYTQTARALVREDMTFAVPIPELGEKFAVFVNGRYLALKSAVLLEPNALPRDLVLNPRVGGFLEAQVFLPVGYDPKVGSPIEEALVKFRGQELRCDSRGRVEFRAVETPVYGRAAVSLPGLVWNENVRDVRLKAAESESLELDLDWGATIRGTVTDSEGVPVAGELMWPRYVGREDLSKERPMTLPEYLKFTTTDKAGRYFLTGLKLGNWKLSVHTEEGEKTFGPIRLGRKQQIVDYDIVLESE